MNRRNKLISLIILGGFLAYAILRYHVFKGIEWIHFPLYTLNKVLSVGGLSMLTVSGIIMLKNRTSHPSFVDHTLVTLGIICILLHVLVSMMLISPTVYESLYGVDQTFNWMGELSMFFGVLGTLFIILFRILPGLLNDEHKYQSLEKIKKSLPPGFLFFGMHVFFLGCQGWLKPSDWPGGMPPISMISFVVAVIGFIITLRLRSQTDRT